MPADLSRLIGRLSNTKLQKEDTALFYVIRDLIDGTKGNVDGLAASLSKLIIIINGGGGGGGGGITNATYLTSSSEVASLPFSRELLAGANISFDDSVAGERTISSAGSDAADYVVASDGATPNPSPLSDGFGQFIYIPYTP